MRTACIITRPLAQPLGPVRRARSHPTREEKKKCPGNPHKSRKTVLIRACASLGAEEERKNGAAEYYKRQSRREPLLNNVPGITARGENGYFSGARAISRKRKKRTWRNFNCDERARRRDPPCGTRARIRALGRLPRRGEERPRKNVALLPAFRKDARARVLDCYATLVSHRSAGVVARK